MFITVIQQTKTEFILSRYQARRGALQFLRGVRQQLPVEEGGTAAILDSWRTECLADRVVLALPPELLSLRELDLPLTDRKKGREILPLELKGELATDADEPVFDALPLAGGKTAAIWGKGRTVAAELADYADKGFDPEIATFAMFSWHQLLPESCDGAVAVTDGEAVAIFLDRKPLYFRALPTGAANQLDTTLAAVELAKDISIETVYTLGSRTIATAAVTEPLPLNSRITAVFGGDATAALDLASTYAMAQELVNCDPVNLRRGTLSFTKKRDQLQKKLRITWGLAAILIILIFAEAGIRFSLVKRDVTSLDSSIRLIYREVFPTRAKAVDEVAELKAEIKKLGATGSEGVLAVLKKLTDAKGDDPREIYEIDFDGSQLTGRGYDRSAQAVNDFKVKAAALFGSFEVSEIKSRPDGSVSFAFRGTLQGGGK
jgi:general secretion pathway protein L